MSKRLVTDALWTLVSPHLPPARAKPKGGRPPLDDCKVLTGILFVLLSSIPWEMLPQEMGCGSGMTWWRRLRDWQDAGVWEAIWQTCLDRLVKANAIDWSRASVDGASYRAKRGALKPAPTRRTGAKRARNVTSWSTPTAFRSPAR